MLRELCQSSRTKPPHVISGDMDSIFPETIDYFTPTSKIEQTPDQDHSDLTKALDLISETEAVANGEVCYRFTANPAILLVCCMSVLFFRQRQFLFWEV